MAGYWLKLYTEILEDPKYYHLSDAAKLGMYELMIVAKKTGMVGNLPSLDDIAFYTRRSVDWWTPVIQELKVINFLIGGEDCDVIRKFEERQRAADSSERQQNYRKSLQHKEYSSNENVTELSRNVTENRLKIKEKIKDSEKSRVDSTASTFPIVTSETYKDAPWKEDWMLAVWREVTGYTSFTGDNQKIIDALDGLRYYRKPPFKDQKEMVAYLKPYCAHWQTLKTKTGIPYSKRNPAWLERAVAGEPLPTDKKPPNAKPDPDCPVCGGMGLYRKDLDVHDPNFGKLTKCECVKVREEVEA